jgi:sugar-specific transcriptional regulator TrmB
MNNINNALITLGLTDKEASIYIALLEIGEATVMQIARQTKLKRPNIYVLLDSLREKELVLKIPHAKKAIFIAKNPNQFFRSSLTKVQMAYASLSEIEAIQKKDNKISVKYYEGEHGVEEALFYRAEELKRTEIVGFFAKAEKISPNLLEISHRWRETMNRYDVTLRGFAPKHETLKEFRKTDEELDQIFKSIPHNAYSSNCSIDATKLFVRIVLFDINQAIIIENLEIVKTVKQIFEARWNEAA